MLIVYNQSIQSYGFLQPALSDRERVSPVGLHDTANCIINITVSEISLNNNNNH